jgi:chaperone protein EcpD
MRIGNYFSAFYLFLFTGVLLVSCQVNASIVITGTRVIYPAGERAVSVKLNNNGTLPVLMQSWIDDGDASKKPDDSTAPFIVTPPINRINPDKGQTLRVTYTGKPLPTDRESVFWLNVLEVPTRHEARPGENYIQVAFRTRIKLFYRPAGLAGKSLEAPAALVWQSSGGKLTAINNTPWYVSVASLSAGSKKAEGRMIAPRSQESFPLSVARGSTLRFEAVNDYGAVMQETAVVQ